jgi:hypothetical protein
VAAITGMRGPALVIANRSHVIIEGLTVRTWKVGPARRADHVVIRKNRFAKATATGTTGGLKLVKSTLNQILDNTFEEGTDSILLQGSGPNLVRATDSPRRGTAC